MNFKFQNSKGFTRFFSKKALAGDRKLTLKKERAKSKVDSVKHGDGDSDSEKLSKADCIILEKKEVTQPTFTCWKLTIETLEQGVKYIQS